jgi:hypothetical protein
MAIARGFRRTRKKRPVTWGNDSEHIMYSAVEVYAAIHLPFWDMVRPKDSGKADAVAEVEMSSIIVVSGSPKPCPDSEPDMTAESILVPGVKELCVVVDVKLDTDCAESRDDVAVCVLARSLCRWSDCEASWRCIAVLTAKGFRRVAELIASG